MSEQQMPARIWVLPSIAEGWSLPPEQWAKPRNDIIQYTRSDIAERMAEALVEAAILGHGKCTIGKPLAEMIRSALSAFKDSAQDRGAS